MLFVIFLVAIGNLPTTKGNTSCKLVPITDSLKQLQQDLRIFRVDLNLDLPEQNSSQSNYSQNLGIRFKQNRWFLLRGERSNRLLLLFYYYYNFFELLISVSTQSMKLDVIQSPANCLTLLDDVARDLMIRRWLVNTSKIPSESIVGQIDEVCSMFISNQYTFGVVQYHCCKLSDVDNCYDVEEDAWVWILRSLIIIMTIFVFFYFPNFIPRKYTRCVYNLIPIEPIEFRIVRTRDPKKYAINGQTVHSAIFNQMTKLVNSLRNASTDVVYTAKVNSVDIFLQRDQLVSEHDQSVNFFQLFYAYILRCKIRNVDSMKQCCYGPICGTFVSTARRPWPWWQFLDELTTVAIYLLIALPAVPLLYSLSADDLEYEELARKLSKHGYHQTSSFYIGEYAGKVVVAVLSVMYVIHILIVILANSIHEELNNLMEDTVIELRKTRQPVTKRISLTLFKPLTKFGILFLPIFIIGILLSPLIALAYLLITSPVAKLIWRQCTQFCCVERLRYKKYTNPTICGPKVSFCLFLTLLSVFVILTIGFNFILHLLCIIVVNMLINIGSYSAGVSLAILIIVYIRDTSGRLTGKYAVYHKALLAEVLKNKQEEVAIEARKNDRVQNNTVFQFDSSDFSNEVEIEGSNVILEREALWDIKHGYLRMHTNGTVLFLDEYDIPYIAHKFFRQMTLIKCSGCPGTIHSSISSSLKELGKIGLFLLFLFILVLAYGDTAYVSPTSKLFATVATGLIPLSLRYFFFNSAAIPTLDKSTLRFQNLFQEQVLTFEKKWPLADFTLTLLKDGANTSNLDGIYDREPDFGTSTHELGNDQHPPERSMAMEMRSGKPVVDLVFDLTGGQFVETHEV